MAWIDSTYSQIQPCYQDTQNVQIIQQPAPQQPTTIFQQIQPAVPYPSQLIRRAHVKKDLLELMMIQNAQMHQVIMSNMTMSALGSFRYCQAPPATEPITHPVTAEDESPEICHHYYQPVPYCLSPSWIVPPQPQAGIAFQACSDHQAPVVTSLRDSQQSGRTGNRSAEGIGSGGKYLCGYDLLCNVFQEGYPISISTHTQSIVD